MDVWIEIEDYKFRELFEIVCRIENLFLASKSEEWFMKAVLG